MTGESGTRDLNQKYTYPSLDYLRLLSKGVRNGEIAPLVTIPKSVEARAWVVAVERLFSRGYIPRIYWCVDNKAGANRAGIISRLRATFPDTDVIFSVISLKTGRVLISGSSSSGMEEPQESIP